jgi:hypothetical protein
MKVSSLFNIITDAQDLLDLFDGVTNVDQLRGRLRRLSQIEADDLLTCLDGLQTSVSAALNDTLEISPDLEDPEDALTDPEPLLENEPDSTEEPETLATDQTSASPSDM